MSDTNRPDDSLNESSLPADSATADSMTAQGDPSAANAGGPSNTLDPRAEGADNELPANASRFEPPERQATTSKEPAASMDLLDDVELDVKIELGRTEMYIEDVLRLGYGSVVELDKLAGDPVDIFVNDRLIARGEVLILNENFCVRVNEILSTVPDQEREG